MLQSLGEAHQNCDVPDQAAKQSTHVSVKNILPLEARGLL